LPDNSQLNDNARPRNCHPRALAAAASLLGFSELVQKDFPGMKPKDMIDIQSFIWVQGSSEYDE